MGQMNNIQLQQLASVQVKESQTQTNKEKVAKVTTIPGYNAVNSCPTISYHKEELAIGKQLGEEN